MSDFDRELGQRLRWCRTVKGLTQEDVQAKAGISKGFLSDVENGKQGIGVENFMILAKLYDRPLEWLLTGEYLSVNPRHKHNFRCRYFRPTGYGLFVCKCGVIKERQAAFVCE